MKKIKIAVSLLCILAIVIIVTNDAKRFDTTDGAYEYPYTGYSGYPFDFENFTVTENGLRDTCGIVMEFEISCTTGQITGFLGPIPIPIKKISERAVIIHKPQLACLEKGFTPVWKY